MKKSLARPRSSKLSGFTLVELLVVIAIIAILASVILYAGTSAINAAKRAKAANMATQIQTAVLGYYTEYSVYPVVSAATPVDLLFSSKTDWQPMTVCLCGGIDPGMPGNGQYATQTIPNTRQITYLTVTAADLDLTSTPAVPKLPFTSSTGAIQYYQMAIDADYSGILGDTGVAGAKPPDFSAATMGPGQVALPFAATKALACGVAVWGNCDPKSTATTTHPNFWVHTY